MQARGAMGLLLGAAASPSEEHVDISAAYEKSAKLQDRTANKVFKDRVAPHWLETGDRFWYRNDLSGGRREFILVDAVAGQKNPAFNHAHAARELSTITGKMVDPERLPVDALEFRPGGNLLLFNESQAWIMGLPAGGVKVWTGPIPALASIPAGVDPRPSVRTGPHTRITFVNRTGGDVLVSWIDAEGKRRPYFKVPTGAEREQGTYSGHVWLVTDPNGKVLGVFEAVDDPGTAVVDGKLEQSDQHDGPNRQGRESPKGRESPEGRELPVGRESPDGVWLAFIRDHNIWLRGAGDPHEAPLTHDGTAEDYYEEDLAWSPDSQRLVALSTQKEQEHLVYMVESSPADEVQPRLHSHQYLKPGDRISATRPHLFEVGTRAEIPIDDSLFPNPWELGRVRWSRDSSQFTFFYNQRGHQVLRIIGVNALTGAARAIVDERSPTFIDYAGKLFVEFLDDTDEIIWMSERDGWNHLYLYDATAGRVKNRITSGQWVVRRVERVDVAKRQLFFSAGGTYPKQDPYYLHYCRVNLDGTGLVKQTEGDGTHSLQYSPDGRFLLDSYSRVDLPPVTELRDEATGRLICPLETADASELRASGWRAPERFVSKGRDGVTDIYGVIIRPTHLDRRRKYPVIENIYAGPQSAYTPKAWAAYHAMQEMAELGFILVQMDGMGTSNRSKAFHDVCWRNLGDAGFPDRIPWIRAAAERYPYMDLSRVGIYGGSAGGQNALGALLFHGDFYKVCVADCGCHDNRMDKIWWNELWMGWPVGPWYAEQSNVTNAHRLTGKALLIVGELDTNVDPASTMQVVNALVKADRDFEMLVIPGANHGAAGTPYGRRRQKDFLVRHLLRIEPPATV